MKKLMLLVGGLALFCSEAWAWQININGTSTGGRDLANAVALDGAGNVVALEKRL